MPTDTTLLEFNQHREQAAARQRRVAEFLTLYEAKRKGSVVAAARLVKEATSTAEFPAIFGDIIDRQVLARFTEWTPPFERFMAIGTFRDLTRTKVRRQQRGGNEALNEVGELSPYPARGVRFVEFDWKGSKFGADFPISFEAMLADAYDEFTNFPSLLTSAVRITEGMFATRLYVDSNGPHASLYNGGYGNVTDAPLSIEALGDAIGEMSSLRDPGNADVPIFNRPRYLVVPPQLEITARAIVESATVAYSGATGAANPLPTTNIVSKFGLEVVVDPNIPVVATTNGDTSWFLFSDPRNSALGPGFPAAQFDRLMGFERPLVLRKRGEFEALGGGPDPRGPLDVIDGATYRVVHAFGGARLFPQATYASNGAG